MERRQFLAGGATSLAVLAAGCAGFLGGDGGASTPSPGATPTLTAPTSPDDPTDTAQSTPTPAATPSPTPTETGTPTASPTPTPDKETEREAFVAYRDGYEDRQSYDRSTHVARIGFNRAKYGGAAIRYNQALESARAAIAHFEEAAALAGREGHAEARDIAEESIEYTERFLIPFVERGIDAAQAAKQGRFPEARDHVAEMASISSDARSASIRMVVPRVFGKALGL